MTQSRGSFTNVFLAVLLFFFSRKNNISEKNRVEWISPEVSLFFFVISLLLRPYQFTSSTLLLLAALFIVFPLREISRLLLLLLLQMKWEPKLGSVCSMCAACNRSNNITKTREEEGGKIRMLHIPTDFPKILILT